MKQILISLTILFGIHLSSMGNTPGWMRSPAISPDGSSIAFTYKGDIYVVSSNGGEAKQLTFHSAHDHKVAWSPDGQMIAFSSDRYGNFDIFKMDSKGGPATRLTYHSANEEVYAYSPDGSDIYFGALRQDHVDHRQYPHRSQGELYSVPSDGGKVSQVLTTVAENVVVSKNGKLMLYQDRTSGEDIFRKHHQSSATRNLWRVDLTTQKHKQLTTFTGEDTDPTFSQDENHMYYLSEASGSMNVYKMNLTSSSPPVQLTKFKLHPIRFLSQGNGTLCFGYHGDIYTMKDGGQPTKVEVEIRSQDEDNKDKIISIKGGIEEMAVSPNGKEIAFIARGEAFVTSTTTSLTKRLTSTPERERFITWGPEGKSIEYSREKDGKWSIYKTSKIREEEPFFYASTLIEEAIVLSDAGDNYLHRYSPDGKQMAYIDDRRNLVVKVLKTNSNTTLLSSEDLFHMRDGDKYFRWSPDSKWLLVDWGKYLHNSEVLLLAADGSKRVNLTESGYYDSSPKWVNKGKQMIWFSNRDGLKSYATSGRSESDVYTMFFDQEAWDHFQLSEDDYKLKKEIEEAQKEKKKKEEEEKKKEKDKEKDKKEEEVKLLSFDWDDMDERKARLTIHSSRLGDAVLSKDNEHLYYLSAFEGSYDLWAVELRTKETKKLMSLGTRGGSLTWDKKQENLYLLSGGSISKIDVKGKKKKGVKISEEMLFDENTERQAAFDHVWIRTNAIFYHPDFHGIDWNQMKDEYASKVSELGNNYELAELLSEMLGELNVSHAGARYRSNNGPTVRDVTASLGILMDYDYNGAGIKIAEVLKGGPLDKSNINVTPSMIIKKIDGITISNDIDHAKYLNRKAGKITLLEIENPSNGKIEMVTMKPIELGQENRLLYKRWVKKNEKEVAEKTNGKIGYVHIPGMSDGPYRSIYQDMLGKYDKADGVIVDTRFNGGGDLVADLAMFFTGVPFITYATEDKVVGGEPTSRWTKPTIALINEAQYSDGHCFACGYSDLKIGTTVGMPTPGTCSFAGWERLPNGVVWGVVPISAKDINGNWMENNQTNPDVMVKLDPEVVSKGKDQQLDKAIELFINK